jgi:hypothetical protein
MTYILEGVKEVVTTRYVQWSSSEMPKIYIYIFPGQITYLPTLSCIEDFAFS